MSTTIEKEEIKYAKWPRLVKLKESYLNAESTGKPQREIETAKYLYEKEVTMVIESFYKEYNTMLERLSHDKIAKTWFPPRKKRDDLETAKIIIIEVEKLREVIKNLHHCSKCHSSYIFECACTNK